MTWYTNRHAYIPVERNPLDGKYKPGERTPFGDSVLVTVEDSWSIMLHMDDIDDWVSMYELDPENYVDPEEVSSNFSLRRLSIAEAKILIEGLQKAVAEVEEFKARRPANS